MALQTFLAPLVLAAFLVPSKFPPELDACVVEAAACMEQAGPFCGAIDPQIQQACIASFEDCSFDYIEAHQERCRIDYAWCVLECSAESPDDYSQFCAKVEHECSEPVY